MGSIFDRLDVPRLDTRPKCATPKHELPTKLDRAEAKKKAAALDERKLAEAAKQAKERDGWKDRMTGRLVKSTRAAHPDRAEAHHVEPRENVDTRYDTRNLLTLSFKTHDAVERNKIRIVGTAWFTVNKRRYINCDYLVHFVEVKS